jgi:CheY-like chemotaxis protein
MIKFKIFGFGSREKKPVIQSMPEPQSSTPAPQPNSNGKRVLIVDDDPVFLRATAMRLQSAGFQVSTASESSEAIAALGENPSHVVLMDVNFPPDVSNGGMVSWDGFQLMNWLRGLPTAKGVRFIMVSESDSPANRKRAKELGALAYFQKPLDHERLFATVNAMN